MTVEWKFPRNWLTNTLQFSLMFQPLQIIFIHYKSRLVVYEDDNVNSGLKVLLQCSSNVSDDGPTTTQHSVYIGYFATIAVGVTISSPVVRKATTQTHWPNCESMSGNRLRRWPNIIPTKTQIHWPNCKIMLGKSATLSQHYSNQNPLTTK